MAPWWLRAGTDEDFSEDPAATTRVDDGGLAVTLPPDEPEAATVVSEGEPAAAESNGQEELASLETPAAKLAGDPAAGEPAVAEAAANEEAANEEAANEEAANEEAAGEAAVAEATSTEPDDQEAGEAAPVKKRRRRRRRKSKKPASEAVETAPGAVDPPTPGQTPAVPSVPTEAEPPLGVEMLHRGPLYPLAERAQNIADERKIAMFCDLENIALGVRDSEIDKLDFSLILERLLEKGKIIVKKAYADWERYSEYKKPFHEAAIELIDIPQKYYSGKNSADIKMVVDAMDLCYSKEHLDTFVLVSGDSDFSPLVSKLKENNKYVIGVGVKNSSSNLLIDNCDEFIYYEDIWRDIQRAARLDNLSPKDTEVFGLLFDAMFALMRENKDILWGSMIKQTMQRKRPSFNEGYYGYSSFSELLEDAKRKNVIELKRDQRSGNYVVTGFANRR